MTPIEIFCRHCNAIIDEECHASWSGLERDPNGEFHTVRVRDAEKLNENQLK